MPIFGKEPVKSKPLNTAKMIFDHLKLVIFNFDPQVFVSYWEGKKKGLQIIQSETLNVSGRHGQI